MSDSPEVIDLLRQIDKRLEVHLSECRLRCQMLERHDRTLYGNGQTGLASRVNLLMWVLGVLTVVGTGLVVSVLGGVL
jgi:hypothetical protein